MRTHSPSRALRHNCQHPLPCVRISSSHSITAPFPHSPPTTDSLSSFLIIFYSFLPAVQNCKMISECVEHPIRWLKKPARGKNICFHNAFSLQIWLQNPTLREPREFSGCRLCIPLFACPTASAPG